MHVIRSERKRTLMVSSKLVMTMDLSAENSVCSWVSSTDQYRWNCRVLSYQAAADSISLSGWLPTTWSMKLSPTAGLRTRRNDR